MAQSLTRNEKIIRILSALIVLIFAAVLVLRFSPWGTPETSQTPSTSVESSTEETVVPEVNEVVKVTLNLASGPVELELWPEIAPAHVERISTLAAEGFYDGIVFHRVIDGFMAQSGDPTGTGTGGSQYPDLAAEFSDVSFGRGVLGMARSADPNSANSQFFIMLDAAPHLNGQYTAFGRVSSGMDHVDAIKKGSTANNGLVDGPDSIVSMTLQDQ